MKKVLKILKVTALTAISVIVVLLLVSVIFSDGISRVFINELNKNINTRVTISKVNFSLLRSFPRASVEFENVRIDSPESPLLPPDSLSTNRPLLQAESIYGSFSITDLIRKKYNIGKIELNKGSVFIDIYRESFNNLDIWKYEQKENSNIIDIDLKNILIKNSELIIRTRRSGFLLKTHINNASGKLSLNNRVSTIDLKVNTDLHSILTKKSDIISGISDIDLLGNVIVTKDSLLLEECVLFHNKSTLAVSGPIYTKNKSLKLGISSDKLAIESVLDYFPSGLKTSLKKHINTGYIRPDLLLSGTYKPNMLLNLGGSLNINDAELIVNDSTPDISISELKSELNIALADPSESANLDITKFSMSYAGTEYSGSLSISGIDKAVIDLSICGNINAAELGRYHHISGIESISGNIHSSVRLWGQAGRLKKFKADNLFGLNRFINLNFNNLKLKTSFLDSETKNISGNIMIAENAWIDELSFNQSGQNIVANAKIEGLDAFLEDSKKGLEISSGIWADKLDLDMWKSVLSNRDTIFVRNKRDRDKLSHLRTNLTFNIDSLIAGKFSSAQLNGSLNYGNNVINISYLNMLCLDGRLEGNMIVNKNRDKTYLGRAWLELDNIDIHQTFASLNNFGQENIKSENLEGSLSGSLSLGLSLSPDLKPLMPTINTSGNYIIRNGALLNFEPLQKLSRFVEISELEEIRFEELKNDLIIKYNKLYIPTMDINSSAFNISLSGEQSFKGEYEYHLKVLLSDILGKKAMQSDSYITEFGRVEDDGLGKTTLYLKVKGNKEDSDISYDVRNLSHDIRKDLKEEKIQLKTILNEEYGWYKGDSLSKSSAEKSKRFRITWEEDDNTEEVKEEEEKPKGFRLFKRLKEKSDQEIKKDTIIKKF